MYLDPTTASAGQHRADMLRDAANWRLAALARCSQPTVLLRRARTLLAWARAGQLGAGYLDPQHPKTAVRDNDYFQPCCA